jgi:hypothetical protein
MSLKNEVTQLIGKSAGVTLECNPTFTRTSEQIAQTISAFASADGGFILFGVTKQGELKGLSPGYRIEEVMAGVPQNLNPQPKFTPKFVTIEGKQVYAIKVEESEQEVLVKGQRFVREGSKTVLKTAPQAFNLPPEFVQTLKKQVAEQYEEILRYRDLKNNAANEVKRQKYQEEIDLRQQNIKEIQQQFLQDAKMLDGTTSESDLQKTIQQVVIQTENELKPKPVIFTAFANPDDDLKNLSREYKEIQKILAPLEAKKHIAKHYSLQDIILKEYFNFLHDWENQLTIFHFGGHAGSLAIGLQDGDMSFEHLAAELLRCNPNSLQLVFLNGCATEEHVQHLFELGAKAVIATATKVYDKQASSFAITFYEYLAKGDTIAKAFDSAANFVQSPNGSAQRFSQGSRPIRWSEGMNHQGKFPWGLYINDDEVGGYRLVKDRV